MCTKQIPELIIQLTEGLSGHTKTATRFWLALAIISIVTVMPVAVTPDSTKNVANVKVEPQIQLPFGLAKVNRSDFYPFASALISIFIIVFGAANCQVVRSRKLISRTIQEMGNCESMPEGLDMRDAFDVIHTSSIQRTAPIAQILLGKHQFFPEAERQPKILRQITICYQLILKLITYLVIYIFPSYALCVAFFGGGVFSSGSKSWGIPVYFFWLVSGIALIIMLQLLLISLKYAYESFCKVWNSRL